MEIILTHNNTDFDAIASQLAAWKLYPSAVPLLAIRLNRDVSEFMALYGVGLPFVNWHDAKIKHLTRIILTDTHTCPAVKGAKADTPILIIEHHPQERPLQAHETWSGDLLGAVTTFLVEQIQFQQIVLTALEATLMALGIYSDTGMLTYAHTTPRDVRAVAWLLEQGASLDTIRRFLVVPLDDKQQNLYEQLLKSAETRSIQGYPIAICHAQVNHTVDGINLVTRRISEVLDPSAIFVVVQLPRYIQLVARSSEDAIQVGQVASLFGGGGHPRAAAASIDNQTSEQVVDAIWQHLNESVRPLVSVGDLMSYGVQTVQASESVRDIVPRLRRIGHEGYPVIDHGKVIGLLTRRDADRTLEHGLVESTVGDIMQVGAHTLAPSESVSALEQLMVNSGWGQIPVVSNGQLIGIVTRTDLLKHWANTHPSQKPPQVEHIAEQLDEVLGSATAYLVKVIAQQAQQQHLNAYLVGGIVRDLLLNRPNRDVDFVIEGDAIAFANSLAKIYGGTINSFAPFGTAKWHLDARVAHKFAIPLIELPRTVDFATARNEFYAHPTALPTVYSGSIKLDLGRRDFTINALAIQVSPANTFSKLVDYYGGLNDLDLRMVRVLHSLSFVDDPTRILRAIRFSERYQFTIEERTAQLIHTALPMLGRITGERLRNELTLLFKEDTPEKGIQRIRELGVDRAIHPLLQVTPRLEGDFQLLRAVHPTWSDDLLGLHWHILLADLPPHAFMDVADRLLIAQTQSRRMKQTAELWQNALLADETVKPSVVVSILDGHQPISLLAVWIMTHNPHVRQHLEDYVNRWQHMHPHTNGNILKAKGLTPSPQFSRILATLRTAWLDGLVHNISEEEDLLAELLKEVWRDRA